MTDSSRDARAGPKPIAAKITVDRVLVIFERVDSRRYRIGIVRNGRHDVGPDVPVRPGPGDATVPHDLVHFVVEEQARLRLGIFGQVAAGGDCGGFFSPAPTDRRPGVDGKRSARLGRAGRKDVAVSERLAAIASTGSINALPASFEADARLVHAINDRLAQLLTEWEATPPGGQLRVEWPDALTIRNGRIPAAL